MNLLWVFMILFSYIFSFFAGTTEAVTSALFSGAEKAVMLVISLLGMMCFWTGVLEVAERTGLTEKVQLLLRPLIRFLFPGLSDRYGAKSAITMSIVANLFGLSNAATPLGIAAMQKLQKDNPFPDTATDDMCMFVVINSASITLIPTTLLTLRTAAGSREPFAILIPVWICSFLSVASGVLAAKMGRRRSRI